MGWLEDHLEECQARNLRPSTIAQRRYAVRRFARFLADRDLELAEADEQDVAAWLARPIAPETRATEHSHLRQFYGWATRHDLLDRSPLDRIRRPKVPRRLPRPIPEADLAIAVELAPPRVRPWLLLAGWAGLRCAEIAPLRAEHILWSDRVLVIAEGKGGGMGSVPMGRYLVEELGACSLPLSGYLFERRNETPGPIPAHLVSHIGNAFLRSIGLPMTMHQLRHRFGTAFYRASGRDLRQTQEAMRHLSSKSTEGYTWIDPGAIADTVDRLPIPERSERLFKIG